MSYNRTSRRHRLPNDPGNSGLNRNAGNERPGSMPLRNEVDSNNSDCFQLPPEECPAEVPSATFSGWTPHVVECGSSHFKPTQDCPRERYQEAMLDAQEAYLAEMPNASLRGWMPPVDEYGSTCFERKPDCPREQEETPAEERYKGLSGLTHYSDYPGGLHLERIEDNPREQNPEYMLLMELYLSIVFHPITVNAAGSISTAAIVVAKEPFVADFTWDQAASQDLEVSELTKSSPSTLVPHENLRETSAKGVDPGASFISDGQTASSQATTARPLPSETRMSPTPINASLRGGKDNGRPRSSSTDSEVQDAKFLRGHHRRILSTDSSTSQAESSSSGGPIHIVLPRPPANNSNLGQEGDSSRQPCLICQRGYFRDIHNYNEHMSTHKPAIKIRCPEEGCDTFIKRKRDIKRHRKEQHSGQERFECLQCSKSYVRECTLMTHIRNIH
ncbi:unnamed protein product [Mortierella alpina]